jgi:hypothetical protein
MQRLCSETGKGKGALSSARLDLELSSRLCYNTGLVRASLQLAIGEYYTIGLNLGHEPPPESQGHGGRAARLRRAYLGP